MKKTLLFLCGPNGIGKTTVSKRVVELRPGTAYVDSDPCRFMNPFTLNDETIPTIAKNLSDLIGNFMDCPLVDTVTFTYGFHGRRREVFERTLANLHDRSYRFLPLLLWCSEEENLRRSRLDGRDEARILRGLTLSRQVYGDVEYPRLDMTHLTVDEGAQALIRYIETGNIFGE